MKLTTTKGVKINMKQFGENFEMLSKHHDKLFAHEFKEHHGSMHDGICIVCKPHGKSLV